jgi:hypothetical protein
LTGRMLAGEQDMPAGPAPGPQQASLNFGRNRADGALRAGLTGRRRRPGQAG